MYRLGNIQARGKLLHSFASLSWVLVIILHLGNTHETLSECTFTDTSGFCTGEAGKFLRPANDHKFHVIRAFYIMNSDLTSLTAEDFSQFQSLITLHINNCSISHETTRSLLSGLKTLTALQITYSNLSDDVISMFANNIALNSLTLQRNLLTRIGKDSFSHLKEIQSIDISNNTISEIEEGAFMLKNMPSLQKLNLAYNTLGEHFDPSVAFDACDACGDACSAGCRANAAADHLWQQFGEHYDILYLQGNPLCSKIENLKIDDVVTEPNDTTTHTDQRQTFLFRVCNHDAIDARSRRRKHDDDSLDPEFDLGDDFDTSIDSADELDRTAAPSRSAKVSVTSDLPPTPTTEEGTSNSVKSRLSIPAIAGGGVGHNAIPSPSSEEASDPSPSEGPPTPKAGYVVVGVILGISVAPLAALLFVFRGKILRRSANNETAGEEPTELDLLTDPTRATASVNIV